MIDDMFREIPLIATFILTILLKDVCLDETTIKVSREYRETRRNLTQQNNYKSCQENSISLYKSSKKETDVNFLRSFSNKRTQSFSLSFTNYSVIDSIKLDYIKNTDVTLNLEELEESSLQSLIYEMMVYLREVDITLLPVTSSSVTGLYNLLNF